MEGLFDEIAGAALQRAHRHRHVAVAGDEDDRQPGAQRLQLFMEFETAHFGHPDVEYQTTAHIAVPGAQEALAGVETGDAVCFAFEQPGHRVAHGLIVVDHKNGLLELTHLLPLSER